MVAKISFSAASKERSLWREHRLRPTPAFSRFPPIRTVALEGQLRVDLSHCQRAQEPPLFCAELPLTTLGKSFQTSPVQGNVHFSHSFAEREFHPRVLDSSRSRHGRSWEAAVAIVQNGTPSRSCE
jgi:hypothetical protein